MKTSAGLNLTKKIDMIGNPLFSLYASHEKTTTMERESQKILNKLYTWQEKADRELLSLKNKIKFKKRSNTVAQSNHLTRNGTEG